MYIYTLVLVTIFFSDMIYFFKVCIGSCLIFKYWNYLANFIYKMFLFMYKLFIYNIHNFESRYYYIFASIGSV